MTSHVEFRLPFGWFDPPEHANGQVVFAFDRDRTVDVNPPRNGSGVPLEWVRTLAHKTDHVIFATGNQKLKTEAEIPGTVESVAQTPSRTVDDVYGGENPPGHPLPRDERVRLLQDAYPNAAHYIVVDDVDLSELTEYGWVYYTPQAFVTAVQSENVSFDPSPLK